MAATGGDGGRSSRAVLAVGIAAMLVAGLVAVVMLRGDQDDRDGGPAADAATGAGSGDAREAGAGAPFDPEPRDAVQGRARSLVFEGRFVELTSVRLDGLEDASVDGEVRGPDGAPLGQGRIEARSVVQVTGSGLILTTTGMRLRPGQPAVVTGGSRELVVSSTAPVQLTGEQLTFRRRGNDGEEQPTAVSGPVTIEGDGASIEVRAGGEQLRWTDGPTRLVLAGPVSGRATMSWAGEGTIEAPGGPVRAGFLGLKAQRLQGEVVQDASGLLVTAAASLRQVYADGVPQLRTTAAVVVKEVRPAAAGQRAWFRWAPENRGPFDMAITRIAPASEAAGWVNLALDQLPEMCGGEPCPRHGGDTSGLAKRGSGGFLGIGSRSAQPIDAVILPGTGDESEVSVDIPTGTATGPHVVSLLVEGNFDPVRVDITIDVT